MGSKGLESARSKMQEAGVDAVAVDTFAHYYRLLEHGETGMIPESTIEPLDMERLDDVEVSEEVAAEAIGQTAVIKLNGGLGTSMGMDRAKSLLCVRRGLSFLDILARQVLHVRETYDARLPLLFMNSFRTSADTLEALERYEDLAVEGLPLDFLQNKEPKLLAEDLMPASYPKDPDLEWCPPGHGDIYPALLSSGLLDRLLDAGYRHLAVSNADNLGAAPDGRLAAWFAASGADYAAEVTPRTPMDRKGGHLARRRSDGRIVLRDTAQTPPEELGYFTDETRHPYAHCNNLWLDLEVLRDTLRARDGALGLPLIRNPKTVDPRDPSSTPVIQIESSMGTAIEVFERTAAVVVPRSRFLPVKSTSELLLVRSDVYDLDDDHLDASPPAHRPDRSPDRPAWTRGQPADRTHRHPDDRSRRRTRGAAGPAGS